MVNLCFCHHSSLCMYGKWTCIDRPGCVLPESTTPAIRPTTGVYGKAFYIQNKYTLVSSITQIMSKIGIVDSNYNRKFIWLASSLVEIRRQKADLEYNF